MKITKDTRLSFQVETAEHGTALIHSIPIGRETFGLYFAELGGVFNACYGDDDEGRHLAMVGPRVAYFALQAEARKRGTWEGPSGVQNGLVNEIVRLTQVSHVDPNGGGWKTIPMDVARQRKILDEDAEEEVLSGLVFFTAACRAGSRKLVDAMLPVIGESLGWEYGFSTPTAYIDSLTRSTLEDHKHTGEPSSTPESGKLSSIIA